MIESIGPYQVLCELGRGGMGEVYRARDTRLDREVAIKVLPQGVAKDPERVARFEREARLLASLSHPHIAGVYGFDESNGTLFLVMEYVAGQTLTKMLESGPLPIDDTLRIARQMAEALEEAHERGIVHRDLKPGNVMITPEGRVKVLDFGLAKALAEDPPGTSDANSPTITANFTRPGVVLGTAAYMSPEQARGRNVDKRTDIWSFGVVLYEMLTGISPFSGETVSDSIGAILHKELDLSLLATDTPPTVQLLLRRCLTRDSSQRLRDIGDARIEIENAIADPSASAFGWSGTSTAPGIHESHTRSPLLRSLWVAVVLAVVAATVTWMLKPVPPSLGPIRAELRAPKDARIVYAGDLAGPAVVSPDGTMIAFVAQKQGDRQRIWLRRLTDSEPRSMRGTERAQFPFWSPDSKHLGYFALGKLNRIEVVTGTSTTICDTPGARGGAWLPGDVIVVSPEFQDGLVRVPASGGTPERITEVDRKLHSSHRWPADVGDGSHFLFSAINHDPAKADQAGIYLGSLDGTPPRRIVGSLLNGQFALGHLLYVRDTVLIATSFDPGTGTMRGDKVPLANDVTPDLSTWHAAFSVSSAGLVAYHRVITPDAVKGIAGNTTLGGGSEANVTVKYGRNGQVRSRIAEGIPQLDLRVGRHDDVAISVVNDREFGTDLWIYELGLPEGTPPDPTAARRVTSLPFVETAPVWSPDGTELAFSHMFVGNGKDAIYRKKIGGGVEHKLVETEDTADQIWPEDWTLDGKYLIYTTGTYVSRLQTDLHLLPLDGSPSVPLLVTDNNDFGARVSPNGKWMAYCSGTAMHTEVYVIPFAPERGPIAVDKSTGLPAEQWQISVGGGISPCWRGDGKELYYISDDGILVAVNVEGDGDTFTVGTSTNMFPTAYESGTSFDVQPDGERFLFTEITVNDETPISLVLHWDEFLH